MQELEHLSQLKEHGILSEEEYEAKKKQILGLYAYRGRSERSRALRLRRARGCDVTAIFLVAIAVATGCVYAKATQFSVVYGSPTAALVFLYSGYLYACALLFGAEIAAAWSRPLAPSRGSVKSQLAGAVRGLFVHRPRAEHPRRRTRNAPPPP